MYNEYKEGMGNDESEIQDFVVGMWDVNVGNPSA